MRRRAFLATAASIVTPLAAGCGGDGSGGPDGSGSTTAGRGATIGGGAPDDESAGMAAYPDYGWERLTRADAAETTEVALSGSVFRPLVARFAAGLEVTFTNEDASAHTVTIPALDVDDRLDAGERTAVTVESAGSYDYVCRFHPPEMLGRLVVPE